MNAIQFSHAFGAKDFTEMTQKQTIIDEDGDVHEDAVALHDFVARGPKIADNLRERFKGAWNELQSNPKYLDEEFNCVMCKRLLRQYDIFLMLIDKVEHVAGLFQQRLKTYDGNLDKDVPKDAVVKSYLDAQAVTNAYLKFASDIRANYLVTGKNMIGVQVWTSLWDRHAWLKEAVAKKEAGK